MALLTLNPILFQNGTKSNPFTTFVNTDYPERNRGMFGFEVRYMGDIQFKNVKHQAFKVRAIVSPLDFIAYKVTIPSEHKFLQFKDLCTILKGPSRLFWHPENKVFEDTVADTILDAATKSNFQHDALKIDRGASSNVAVECIPLKLEQSNDKNKFNIQMNEFGLMWTIGVAGGEELVDDNDDEVDSTSLF
eukprot:459142-Ditylum_brightwellii.AAC.1